MVQLYSPHATNIGGIYTIENIETPFAREVAFFYSLPLLFYADRLEK